MKNIVNHFLIAFKPIKGFSLLATTDFILITGGSGGFNGDGQMHRILSGGGGNLLGGEGGCAWSIVGGGSLLLWGGGGGGGMAGLMKSFPLGEGKDLLTMGKKQNECCNNSAVHGWVEGSRSLFQISKKYN